MDRNQFFLSESDWPTHTFAHPWQIEQPPFIHWQKPASHTGNRKTIAGAIWGPANLLSLSVMQKSTFLSARAGENGRQLMVEMGADKSGQFQGTW